MDWVPTARLATGLVLQQKAEEAEAWRRPRKRQRRIGAKEKTETTKLPEAEKVDESWTRTDLWQQVFWFWVRSSRTGAGRR